ncbi:MAG: hypothetical protein R3F61_05510 [Myxococcota bacterium]
MSDAPPGPPTPDTDAATPALESPAGWPPWVQQWVMPFLQESGLWPVLVAILGHVVILIAPMLAALSRGNRAMSLPITVVVMVSFWLCRTEYEATGRLRGVTLVVVLVWLASIALGAVAGHYGIL